MCVCGGGKDEPGPHFRLATFHMYLSGVFVW